MLRDLPAELIHRPLQMQLGDVEILRTRPETAHREHGEATPRPREPNRRREGLVAVIALKRRQEPRVGDLLVCRGCFNRREGLTEHGVEPESQRFCLFKRQTLAALCLWPGGRLGERRGWPTAGPRHPRLSGPLATARPILSSARGLELRAKGSPRAAEGSTTGGGLGRLCSTSGAVEETCAQPTQRGRSDSKIFR